MVGDHVGLTVGPVHNATVESTLKLVKLGKDTWREGASNKQRGEHVIFGFEFSSKICNKLRLHRLEGTVPEKRFCCS